MLYKLPNSNLVLTGLIFLTPIHCRLYNNQQLYRFRFSRGIHRCIDYSIQLSNRIHDISSNL